MLGKRPLGFRFLSPVFVVVVVVIVVVIVLIIRRKWRRSVERSEEVRRLLVSASEESARAEVAREAYYYTATGTPSVRVSTPAYGSVQLGSPVKPQYQCAVCFRPTTTRCAKCKGVRYCSGKCQIVHWRQGHKEECRPYVAVTQTNNVGGGSNRQGDHKDQSDSFDTEAKQTATPAESKFPLPHEGLSVFSTPTSFPAGVTFEKLETVKSAHGISVSPARKSTGLLDNNQIKSNLSDEDTQSGTSSSSFWTDEGSNESSVSKPSTNSFGFWDGNIPNKKTSINEHDNFAPGSVDDAENGQLANHKTEVTSNINIMEGFHAAKIIDGSDFGSKKSNEIEDLPKGMVNHGSNSSRSPTCTSGMPNHRDRSADSDLPTSKFRESKNSSSSDVPSHHASTAARYSEVSEKSNDIFCNKSTAPDMSKSRDAVSSSPRASDIYSTTVTSRNISHSTKAVKVVDDDNHRVDACSSQFTEASKFRESKNSRSDLSSDHGAIAARYSKVHEKSNDIFCNKSMTPDMSKSMDAVSSSPRPSDIYSTTVTSRNTSHSMKAVKVVDDDNHRVDACSSQFTEASKFRESKNSRSDRPSDRGATAARYSKVHEKSNDIFCNKSMPPDMSKSMDAVSSSPRPSDVYSTTVTSRNISHSTKPMKVVDDDNHRIDACSSQFTEASKFRESKNSRSDVPSDHGAIAARYSKVHEKSNDIFCNKSMTPDMSKSKDAVSSSPRASDAYLTTVTSRNISHSTKPVKVVDDVGHRITTSSSQLTEASRRGSKTSKLKVFDYLKPSKLSHQESSEGGSDTTHNYSFKGLFPYEMFIKLYNCKQVELRPFGLKNCGNSCYANAVLQCLIYTPPLTAYLLEGLHSKACEKRGWCFTCEFEGLIRKAKDGISPLSPVRMLTHIENMGSNLGHGKEEDAHEFLRYVIDALQSVCIKESRKKSLNSLEEETTLIGLTFGGYLRSKIMCMKCGGKSEQHERMMDLTIEIEGDIRTLEEALNKFTCTEILDGENKYKCNRCKSYEKAKKKFTLLEAPNVLTIALKRFQSGKFGKLNKSICFPEILNMAPYVSGTSDKSPIYSLYGVVVHVDTMNAAFSGHYVCYVKNLQNRWFKFDDSMVKEVDLQHVLTKGAYMLLYARCSPRAPRSIRGSIIHHHHHHHHHDPRKLKLPPSFISKSHSTAPWYAHSYHPSHVHHRSPEEETSSSDNSSFFSESCSCSTESTHRDASSIEDHISGDWEPDHHNNINLNSSDSDTSSSSSFPSPLYSRLSRLYSSIANGEEDQKASKVCRNLDCSCSSCRITNSSKLRSTTRGKSD